MKPQSAVRASLGELAPKLVDLTEDVLFGDVWERPQLSFHFPNAVRNGVTQEELVELITQLAFYAGWPSAMSAANRAKALFMSKEEP